MRFSYSLIFIFLCFTAQAQQDVIEDIASASCECIENLDLAEDEDERDTQLGICILQAATEHKEELKAQYDIDLTSMNGRKGEKFGEQVGMKMAVICPQILLKAVQGESAVSSTEETQNHVIHGKLTNIEKGQFYTIQVNADSRNHSMLWLQSFDNSYDLLRDTKRIVGKEVRVYYHERELFDPQINEYRKFKVINKLEWL